MKVIRLTPGHKAAITRKWHRAPTKAHATVRNAKIFAENSLGEKWFGTRRPREHANYRLRHRAETRRLLEALADFVEAAGPAR